MSLSPTTKSAASEVLAYDKGWAAINRLIRAGRSFSGRERNCCFLNVGGPRFATVSGAIDVNLPDDGRGLALTDWDGDGRVDFWLTNRTGPRVRFLKNEYNTDHHFVSLQLIGTVSNRDAIGARVELYLANQSQPLTKTVYGGSGYISQSSKTVHFGLGMASQIDRIVVRWPGGVHETFATGLSVDQRYALTQGSGIATRVPIHRCGPWTANPAAEPPLPRTDRVVLLQPAPMPQFLSVTSLKGGPRPLVRATSGRRGMVINLWATWCENCLEELKQWSHDRKQFEAAGLDVLTLCVDEPTDDQSGDRARIATFAEQFKLPFNVAVGEPSVIETLNVFQRAFIGRQTDLPLPSSFLIDADGRLAVIYKGPVGAAQIVSDARLLGASREAILAGAIPFDGQWLERPPTTSARMAAVAFMEHGDTMAAEKYARQLLASDTLSPTTTPRATDELDETASLRHLLGAVLFDRQAFAEARDQYEAALQRSPQDRDVREELARTFLRLDQPDAAAEQLKLLLVESPEDSELLADLGRIQLRLEQPTEGIASLRNSLQVKPRADVRFELANALRDQGQYAAARDEYRQVLLETRSPAVLNNLAWMLATANDESVRDGVEALQLAQQAAEETKRTVPKILGTLAAAYAEQERFDLAVEVLDEALKLAAEKDASLLPELKQRRSQYQQRHPTRESPP